MFKLVKKGRDIFNFSEEINIKKKKQCKEKTSKTPGSEKMNNAL